MAPWSGWPSQRPFSRSLTGPSGRKSAVSQRWLKSPKRLGPAIVDGDETGEQMGHGRATSSDEYPQLVHNVHELGDKVGRPIEQVRG